MGSVGRRSQINNVKEEPSLLGDVQDIIKSLRDKNLIDGCKVNIKSLIEESGVNIVFDDMLSSNQSGYLRKNDDNGWVIGVNKNHNPKRQRFTLAHEFAHFILHKDDNNSFEDEIFFRDENLTSIEYAANEFAAAILMPKNLIEDCLNKGFSDIEDLANEFDVSVLAMKNRVISLGYKLAYE